MLSLSFWTPGRWHLQRVVTSGVSSTSRRPLVHQSLSFLICTIGVTTPVSEGC